MKVTRQTVEHVHAGEITVSIDYDGAGNVDDVRVFKRGMGVPILHADAQLIERVAFIVQTRRLATGNDSEVCATCGWVSEGHDHEKEAKEAFGE